MNLSEDKITRAQRCYQPEEKGWHEEVGACHTRARYFSKQLVSVTAGLMTLLQIV